MELRLLSQQGIPKLRQLSRSGSIAKKLHLKGKGHEFSDAARLLNYYQLWLDNLYPRAKFADGLQLVEKVGHSKRMHVMRKEWIDEGKPGYARDNALRRSQEQQDTGDQHDRQSLAKLENPTILHDDDVPADLEDMFFPDPNHAHNDDNDENEVPDDGELDALLAEQMARTHKPKATAAPYESEGEDDLDALLAEEASRRKALVVDTLSNNKDKADVLDDVVAAEETRGGADRFGNRPTVSMDEADDDDDDDLDALLAEREAAREPELPQQPTPSGDKPVPTAEHIEPSIEELQQSSDVHEILFLSSPVPNEAGDELDIVVSAGETQDSQGNQGENGVRLLSSSPIPNEENEVDDRS